VASSSGATPSAASAAEAIRSIRSMEFTPAP
jgi:hypothetical protein